MSIEWEEGQRVLMVRGPGNERSVQGYEREVPLPAKATVTRITETPQWDSEPDDSGNKVWRRCGVARRLYIRVDGGLGELSISDDQNGWHIRPLDVVERLGDLA